MNYVEKFFRIKAHKSSVSKELFAGLTSFFTMSYLFIISPKLMETAGFPFEASVTALILAVFIGSSLCAFIANKPFVVAPFLSDTAFIAYTVTGILGFSVNTALAAVLLSGLLLFLLSVTGIRLYIFKNIPENIKVSFCAGLGLFFIFIALQKMNIVGFPGENLPPCSSNLLSFDVLAGVFCFLTIIVLTYYKVPCAILIAVLLTASAGYFSGNVPFPEKIFSLPASPLPVLFKLDFTGVFSVKFLPILFLIFMLANIDTTGSLAALIFKTDDKFKSEKHMKKLMIADSLAVILSPIIGVVTSGTYLDSVTGMKTGGKTGLTAFFAGCFFLSGLFFIPFLSSLPAYSYAPALLYVGIIMVGILKEINFDDISECAPALFTIAVMMFTFNVGIGIMSAFITYPLVKLLTGQIHKLNPLLWILFVLSCLFFIYYPY